MQRNREEKNLAITHFQFSVTLLLCIYNRITI